MLGEASIAPGDLGTLLLGLAVLAGFVHVLLQIWDRIVPKPANPPLHRSYADKDETDKRLTHLELKIEAARVENKNEFNSLRGDMHRGHEGIHDRLNHIVLNLAHLKKSD